MTPPPDTAPEFTVIGDGEPTDELLDALAELLLAVVDTEQEVQADG